MADPEIVRTISQNHELDFSSPAQFKDPLDSRPRLTVSSREAALPRILNPFLALHAGDTPGSLAQDVANIHRMVRGCNLNELAESLAKVLHREMEDHRIYSMSVRPDNAHLWKHYAGDSTGCCLEFSSREEPFLRAHHVIYGDELVLDFCDDGDFNAVTLFQKTSRYVDEEEVRIILFPRGQPHEVRFEPRLLQRVILGSRMTEEHREVVRRWRYDRDPVLNVSDA